MRYLFLFAHPDDETAACAGTIKQLTQRGDEVILVSVTDGSGGEVKAEMQQQVEEHGSVGMLRRHELQQVATHLGVKELKILDFEDGQITNEMVWGKLTLTFIEMIDHYKPDIVVTFDHTGWYFHLDHVAVSIAATLAVQQAAFPPKVLLFSYFKVNPGKWKYVFPQNIPLTHRVNVTAYKDVKLHACELHASQDLKEPCRQLQQEGAQYELYQVAFATEEGKKIFAENPMFEPL